MPSFAQVVIHPSQFPEAVRSDLLASLRERKVNHKFHYDSYKQTQKWLALHEAFSPARTDANCRAIYEASFAGAALAVSQSRVQVIGLGCGGGNKDVELLTKLQTLGKKTAYVPSDVSVAMVLTARAKALAVIKDKDCRPLVADLATAENLETTLETLSVPGAQRLVTFFGMIPNFEPAEILPKLSALLKAEDLLLFSANLAPGTDYATGIQQIMPLYDNPLTRDWLLAFLFDLGIEPQSGALRFTVETDAAGSGLKRVEANFYFEMAQQITLPEATFRFEAGDKIRLFFSYRHTPALVRTLLAKAGIQVLEQWVASSGEEGVFLCRRE